MTLVVDGSGHCFASVVLEQWRTLLCLHFCCHDLTFAVCASLVVLRELQAGLNKSLVSASSLFGYNLLFSYMILGFIGGWVSYLEKSLSLASL